jgi:tRNA A-37 threonylcarbamoyl transferase component Bud32
VIADEHQSSDRRLAVRQPPTTSASPRRVEPVRHARGPSYNAVAIADLAPDELARAVETPEFPLEAPTTSVVKRGRSALIVKASFRLCDGETRAAYKRFGSKNWMRRLTRGLQTARAVRNFRLGHKLLRLGIATPRPLLAVSPRWRVLLRPAFLATEWLEGTMPLDAFLRAAASMPTGRQLAILRETANCVGRLVGGLHAHGFAHRDLKATNLLVRELQGRIEVFVIDLDGASKPWFLTRRTRRTNLARLVTATQGLSEVTHVLRRRALGAYLDSCPDSASWKAVWRELREISRIRRSRRPARGMSRAPGR